jgi:hypothetical protein
MPTFISSETQNVTTTATFTVPADCTYVVALVAKTETAAFAAITLGGSSMPETVSINNTDEMRSGIFTLANPLTGSRTFSTSSATYRVTLAYLKDVHATTPVVDSASEGGDFADTFSMDCPSESSALVLDVICVQASGTTTVGTNQTAMDTTSFAGSTRMFGTSYEVASGTPTAMQWTTSASQRQSHCAIAIKHIAGGATAFRPYYITG